MSTIALDYPDSVAVRSRVNLRWITILITGLVLIASVILVAASASVKVETPSGVVAVPVQTAPTVDAHNSPEAASTPAPSPIVIAVPVATAPSE